MSFPKNINLGVWKVVFHKEKNKMILLDHFRLCCWLYHLLLLLYCNIHIRQINHKIDFKRMAFTATKTYKRNRTVMIIKILFRVEGMKWSYRNICKRFIRLKYRTSIDGCQNIFKNGFLSWHWQQTYYLLPYQNVTVHTLSSTAPK